MAWELEFKIKYELPDGSIFVEENWSKEPTTEYEDFDGDERLIYQNTHETKTYFESNKGNWTIKPIFIQHPNWVKSYCTYEFNNKIKTIKLSECKRIGD